jgi:polysaccharide export outer membrane protein
MRRLLGPGLGFACLVWAQAACAGYALQPGDVLRFTVVGIPDAGFTATVDDFGEVSVPRMGAVPAAGRTVAEVLADVQGRAEGQVVKRFGPDGSPVFIALGAEDIHIEIAEHRPIVVTGDVAQPQQVAYRPGMTVRSAIAIAGGLRQSGGVGEESARVVPRLQSEFGALALQHAAQVARLWRVDAELEGARDPAPPSLAGLAVSQPVFEGLVANQRLRLAASATRLDGQREFLLGAITLAEERLKLLERQNEQQIAAVAEDEEEQRRVQGLFDRGVAQMSRVLDIRRSLLLSSTRMLDTQNNMERVALEIATLRRQLDALGQERRDQLLLEREQASGALLETEPRMAAVRELLATYGAEPVLPGGDPSRDATLVIHRGGPEGVTAIAAVFDQPLRPGDVIEAVLPTMTEVAIP